MRQGWGRQTIDDGRRKRGQKRKEGTGEPGKRGQGTKEDRRQKTDGGKGRPWEKGEMVKGDRRVLSRAWHIFCYICY